MNARALLDLGAVLELEGRHDEAALDLDEHKGNLVMAVWVRERLAALRGA